MSEDTGLYAGFFDGKRITITLNKDGYIRFVFSPELKDGIVSLITSASEMFLHSLENGKISALVDLESHLVRTDYIDEVSSITNREREELLDMEMGL